MTIQRRKSRMWKRRKDCDGDERINHLGKVIESSAFALLRQQPIQGLKGSFSQRMENDHRYGAYRSHGADIAELTIAMSQRHIRKTLSDREDRQRNSRYAD